jgi:hypothetical protein
MGASKCYFRIHREDVTALVADWNIIRHSASFHQKDKGCPAGLNPRLYLEKQRGTNNEYSERGKTRKSELAIARAVGWGWRATNKKGTR